ncbi:guanylate-binding protein 2-like isoform X2 [Paramisgurnus dabryanus]|uniref:guanylate-binding protein 2-like isoform X2 n=1 Tax=Paramisgurnus dabryanus TaxID=90735 RepID=UPI0031F35639
MMSGPVCLIESDENGKFHVRKEAKDILDGINEPVVVVSVVGLYRTGKSYLMNRLAGQQSGFALGNTIESKTKGIWMWCIPHPSITGQTLVLLDTEGLGDVDKGDSQNDGWIFCLAVLLSSTLVYNSRGTIDNDAVQKLHYVTELTEQIKIKSTSKEADVTGKEDYKFVCFFPSFVWCVRDFILDLEIAGDPVTEDEYLEFGLNLKKGISCKTSNYNETRECIRKYFPTRKCFVFSFPTFPKSMKHLESLKEQDLDQDFLKATDRFCNYIFEKSAVKTLKGGHRVTGKMLGDLAQIYVDTISSGKVPCLDNAVVALANQENQAAAEDAFKVYKSGMEEVVMKFPVSVTDLTQEHQNVSSQATSEFTKRSFKDENDEYLKNLEVKMGIYYLHLLEENKMASERKCKELLKDLFSSMSERLKNGEYSQCGGYEVYCRDRDANIEKYHSEPNKGVRAKAVLNEFMNERGPEANIILQTDEQLTKREKEIQEEREKKTLMEQKLKEEEEKRIESELLFEAEKKRQEEMKIQMEEKFKKEMKQQQEEIKRGLESKIKEREELLNKGFKEQADLLGKEMNKLKEEQNSFGVVGKFFGNVFDIVPNLLTGKGFIWR